MPKPVFRMKLEPSEFVSIVETIYSSGDSTEYPIDCDPGNNSGEDKASQDYAMTIKNVTKDSFQYEIPILNSSEKSIHYKWESKKDYNTSLINNTKIININEQDSNGNGAILVKSSHKGVSNIIFEEFCGILPSNKRSRCTPVERKFPCDKCEFRSRYKGDLKRHKMIHNNEFPFSCDMCQFKCKAGGSLRRHRMVHFDYMPFKCTNCEMKFRRLDALKSHAVIHQKEKPFSCDLCEFACKQAQALVKHKLVHSNHKLFACQVCSFKCNDKRILRRHEMSHVRLPFFCVFCNRKFKISHSLAKHKLTCSKRLFTDTSNN